MLRRAGRDAGGGSGSEGNAWIPSRIHLWGMSLRCHLTQACALLYLHMAGFAAGLLSLCCLGQGKRWHAHGIAEGGVGPMCGLSQARIDNNYVAFVIRGLAAAPLHRRIAGFLRRFTDLPLR